MGVRVPLTYQKGFSIFLIQINNFSSEKKKKGHVMNVQEMIEELPCAGYSNDPRTDDMKVRKHIKMLWGDLSMPTVAGNKARRKVAERIAKYASSERTEVMLEKYFLGGSREFISFYLELIDDAIKEIVEEGENNEIQG